MNVECSNQKRIRLVYISLCSASQETTKSTSNLYIYKYNAQVTIKAVAGRRVRFRGIGWRVEISEKNARSHLKVWIFSIRPGAG